MLVGGGPEGWKCRGSGAGKDRWMGERSEPATNPADPIYTQRS